MSGPSIFSVFSGFQLNSGVQILVGQGQEVCFPLGEATNKTH